MRSCSRGKQIINKYINMLVVTHGQSVAVGNIMDIQVLQQITCVEDSTIQ